MDWITRLNLFMSHDLHPIKCCKFGYSKCTSSSHCMLGNVHECTMHKLNEWMCIMNSWCTCSELKAPSDYSKCWSVMENAGVKCYTGWWLPGYASNTRSLVECSHVKTMLGQQEALE